MDPVRNPYAPGAGQRPPELAGRDRELEQFDVVLERVARGRPERSLVLTGLRGVGKTVLLNALRSQAIGRLWGTGKIEARPDQSLRRPLVGALHMAVRELAPRHRDPRRVAAFLGVLKAFALRSNPDGAKLRERWQPGIDVAATSGRADTGDIEVDLVELLVDAAGVARDVVVGIAVFVDEMQDVTEPDVSALCAACHELSQQGLPLVVVGAGLPHLPAVLSASKSYSERLFRYVRIDRLDREAADRALLAPAEREDVAFAAPVAEAELAVGLFGSRYDRATPAEREYMHAMAELGGPQGAAVATSEVAVSLGRKPASLSPARDSLIKKGLVYSAERGQIAFTVPHFGRYLLRHPD